MQEVLAGMVTASNGQEVTVVLALGEREELMRHVNMMSEGEKQQYLELYIADYAEFCGEAMSMTLH